MESTRPVRALLRGLDALAVLNLRNGATVTEIAADIRLPRTTTYRILETLCSAGYVVRDGADDRYRLTILVRGLADGFDDEAWVTQIARPFLYELCREIVWPVAIASLSGTTMMVRETTDHRSPLAVERHTAGFRVPILTSASGRAYLAFCPVAQRDALLEILARSAREHDALAKDRAQVLRMLAEVREQGHATALRPRRVSDEASIAVPIVHDGRVLACLTARFSSTAVPPKLATDRFLPRLQDTATRIAARLVEQESARAPAPPDATG